MNAMYLALCLVSLPFQTPINQHEKDVLEMSQVRGWEPCPGDYAICEKFHIPYKKKEYVNKDEYWESAPIVANK